MSKKGFCLNLNEFPPLRALKIAQNEEKSVPNEVKLEENIPQPEKCHGCVMQMTMLKENHNPDCKVFFTHAVKSFQSKFAKEVSHDTKNQVLTSYKIWHLLHDEFDKLPWKADKSNTPLTMKFHYDDILNTPDKEIDYRGQYDKIFIGHQLDLTISKITSDSYNIQVE